MRRIEQQHQIYLVRWFRLAYRKFAPLLASFNNGPNVGPRIMKIYKEMGLTPGMPDLFLAIPTPDFAGLFIEMKSEKGRISDVQKDVHNTLRLVGYDVIVCRNWMDARDKIEDYLNANRTDEEIEDGKFD